MKATRNEIERLAVSRLGPDAKLFSFSNYDSGQRLHWFGLAVAGCVIGCRRSIEELPALIERGRYINPLKPQRNSTHC